MCIYHMKINTGEITEMGRFKALQVTCPARAYLGVAAGAEILLLLSTILSQQI